MCNALINLYLERILQKQNNIGRCVLNGRKEIDQQTNGKTGAIMDGHLKINKYLA